MAWVILFIAILSEVIASTALKYADGFTKLIPSIVVVIGYTLAFFLLSLTMKVIPMGVGYAVWSGIGIILISISGYILFKQSLDTPALVGIFLILIGVLIINIYSKSTA
ncbi:QacE family quaternary ammonium compound efflux SMR transporter [bacterium]|nr:QacE family quaternary ammonium compound efflux SMR transporter [bacterium]